MEKKQSQIKINLPLTLKRKIKNKASGYGMTLAGYFKFLAVKDIKESEYPVYEASDRVEKAVKRAMGGKDKIISIPSTKDLDRILDEFEKKSKI